MPLVDGANINTVLIALIAALVTVVTPAITVWANTQARKSEREEDRKDRAAVANKVEEVAQNALKDSAVLGRIETIADSTHKIVNSQRTAMLRQIAMLSRALSNARPRNKDLLEAAVIAERNLQTNEEEQARANRAAT